ncbi:substrate-binding periplasmic protein [Chitinimonas naiadis]
MPSRHWRAWLYAGLLAIWLPANASSYVVGVEDVDYFPIYSTAGGTYHGYARDLLDLFAQHEGISLSYLPLPVKRIALYNQQGKFDLIYPDNPRWNTEDKRGVSISYSAPTLTFQDAILVKPERLGQPLRSLGMVRGFTPWKFQDEIKSGRIKVESAPGPRNLLQMAMLGRVDGVNMAVQVSRFHLRQMGKDNALLSDTALMPTRDSQYFLSSARHPELIVRFNHFLKTERQAVEALQLRYGF